jgi:hypothetical protein
MVRTRYVTSSVSYDDANQVKFIHAHQIAKNTCRNGTTWAWPAAIVCASCSVTAATATTKVRSNSSSSWLDTRCGSSIGRAVIRTRIRSVVSGTALPFVRSSSGKTRQEARV